MPTCASRGSLIGFALFASAFSPTQRELTRFEFSQVHMGMPVRIVLYAADTTSAERSARAAFATIAALDDVLSDYRPDSELNRLSATTGVWVPISALLGGVLVRALGVAEASDGAFDPTIGPLTSLWRETRRTRRLPADSELADARARGGWRYLHVDSAKLAARLDRTGMRLDLGGIAKGYILDYALLTLIWNGTTRALLEAGGDIVVGDAPPGQLGWRVDVAYAEGKLAERAAALKYAALSTSGATAQFVDINGVRYSHIVDPRTGVGVTHDLVTSVIARDGATADALATALNVLGPEKGAKLLAKFPDVIVSATSRTSRR